MSTLFVYGFGPEIEALDLSLEFKRFGKLLRCEIPTPTREAKVRQKRFAFLEYEIKEDAETACKEMHEFMFQGKYKLTVEFARNPPTSTILPIVKAPNKKKRKRSFFEEMRREHGPESEPSRYLPIVKYDIRSKSTQNPSSSSHNPTIKTSSPVSVHQQSTSSEPSANQNYFNPFPNNDGHQTKKSRSSFQGASPSQQHRQFPNMHLPSLSKRFHHDKT